jgi:rare lipoprotein A
MTVSLLDKGSLQAELLRWSLKRTRISTGPPSLLSQTTHPMASQASAELKRSLPTASLRRQWYLALASCTCITLATAAIAFADETPTPKVVALHGEKSEKLPADVSGHKRVGKASVYSQRFAGHEMANGEPMEPKDNNAASKTLPLGTTAKVTNMGTGKSAVVKITDRGPYVKSRILDLSPSTARKIGVDPKDGVAKVSVEPIAVPLPNGNVKPGVAAHDPTNN